MENIFLIIISVLFIVSIRFWSDYFRKVNNPRKILISWVFDLLWCLMLYIYPFVFDLFLLEDWSSRNGFILEWHLLFRVILASIILFWIPSILSFIKQSLFHKFNIWIGSYFWIWNTTYFLLFIPLILMIINWLISKL